MVEQRRGQESKERILEEACKAFAEKGYRDATHAEICKRARTNIAAINYYFESKESLYRAAFEYLAEKADALYPLDGGLPPGEAPERRLQAFIHAHLSRMFDPERLGYLHRIRMAEMFDPTGLLTAPLKKRLARDRNHVLTILRELLGPTASQRDLEYCEISVVGQCFMAHPGPNDDGPRKTFRLTAKDVDSLAAHILKFSLAGIAAIRQIIDNRAAQNSGKLGIPHDESR